MGEKGKNNKFITILGNNAAGIANKKESFQHIIDTLKPGIIMIQESKLTKKNSIQIKHFEAVEFVRREKTGGGLYTAIHKDFLPVLISRFP